MFYRYFTIIEVRYESQTFTPKFGVKDNCLNFFCICITVFTTDSGWSMF